MAVAGGFDFRDVVTALRAAAIHGRTGESYLVAGHRLSTRQLGELAAACSDRARPPRAAPAWAADACAPIATWVARHTRSPLLPTREALGALTAFPVVDDSKARRELAHRPRPVQKTLTDLYRHFVAVGRVDSAAQAASNAGVRGGPLVARTVAE